MTNLADLEYRTPQQNQGQIVTVSYAVAEGRIVRRTHDASDGTTGYAVADLDWPEDDERWSEWEQYDAGNGAPPKSWNLEWVSVDETGRDLSTLYTYTIFDADPNSSSGTELPDSADIELEADSAEEALELARDELENAAAGLNVSDGYEVGQRLYALVWDHAGQVVGTLTYELTQDDLGVSKGDVTDWESVAIYVSTCPGGDSDGACDVDVQVGGYGGLWFIRTTDDAGGSDECDGASYTTREAAEAAADEFASSHDEAEVGEDAAGYLARVRDDAIGDEDPDGEYCVYWESACTEDEGPRERYATEPQATAAADRANEQLRARNPGSLLCAFAVRRLVDDEWVAAESGE